MDLNSNIQKPGSLKSWLDFLESIDPNKIKLGLDRVKTVFDRLNLEHLKHTLTIEVAGTNGKGSSSALIASALNFSGLKTGLYTSPHLHSFTERIRVNDKNVDESILVQSFNRVYDVKGEVELTYFEYTTLAALVYFDLQKVDAMVLEIGLGGRQDAVNIIDADIALICSVGLDHTHILGNTIKKIAYEKAGIIKKDKKVVCGLLDTSAKEVVKEVAIQLNAPCYFEKDNFKGDFKDGFLYTQKGNNNECFYKFPYPKIPYICAPSCIRVLTLIKEMGYKVSLDAMIKAIKSVSLPGRMQLVHLNPTIYLDVAHNPPAALNLVNTLKNRQKLNKRIALIGMLKDKDIESVLSIVKDSFDEFYVVSLDTARGERAERLKNALISCQVPDCLIKSYGKVTEAMDALLEHCSKLDEIVVLGSFVTVSLAMDDLAKRFKD